jgi:hypothetical protein
MADESKTFMIEDARIILRNFSGREGPYNKAGIRSFGVLLPDEGIVEQLIRDGWNVRYLDPREDGEEPVPFLSIGVRFDIRPPRIVLLTEDTRTQLDENSCEVIDWADIKVADLIARGYEWNVNGKTGVKAYLQSLFVTIEENALDRKYAIHDD